MAKNKVSEWDSNPSSNNDIGGVDIAEGCAPSGINNAIRQVMAQMKSFITGSGGDSISIGGNLTVTGTTTLSNPLPVTSGGTGATSIESSRTNLGLGTISTQNSSNVTITGGTINSLTVTSIGTNSYGLRTVSTSTPTGGSNGDIWYQY